MAFVRPYEAFDRADVYDVCVRTAADGGDARGMYSDDDLMPDVYAGSYLLLEPELAFVLDDGDRAVGYVLGTADTERWAAEHRRRWLPVVSPRYAVTGHANQREEELVDTLLHPEREVHPELAEYPAHLHIDVLPEHQGHGAGRELIRTFLRALAGRDVPGVHLGVSPTNLGALAFYDRLGFRPLPEITPGVVYLGIATDAVV